MLIWAVYFANHWSRRVVWCAVAQQARLLLHFIRKRWKDISANYNILVRPLFIDQAKYRFQRWAISTKVKYFYSDLGMDKLKIASDSTSLTEHKKGDFGYVMPCLITISGVPFTLEQTVGDVQDYCAEVQNVRGEISGSNCFQTLFPELISLPILAVLVCGCGWPWSWAFTAVSQRITKITPTN